MTTSNREKAERFHALHNGPDVLVLANCWDPGSARTLEALGFQALGTTSGGIAYAQGLPDGGAIGRDGMLAAIQTIAQRISVPLTADIENGYGRRPEDVATTIAGVIDAGAVGCNLEDGSSDPHVPLFEVSLAVERIQAAREAAARASIRFFINARTDVYLAAASRYADPFVEAVRRLNAYWDVGADCLFMPPFGDVTTIERLKQEVDGRLSIQAGPSTPPVSELTRLGVARVSTATSIVRATYAVIKRAAEEMLQTGTFTFTAEGLSYAELQALFRT